MKTALFTAVLIAGLAACGDSPPPPKPVATPAPAPAPAPQTKAPEAKAPEAKAPEAPKPDPNKELARRVKQALESERKLQAGEIDVTAQDGRVMLWGTQATADQRTLAGQIAAKVTGVSSVENQIQIVKGS